MKYLILSALKAEARPFIEAYGLIKDSTTHLYQKDNISLFITGVGQDKTEERLQAFLTQITDFSDTVILNIGIAGGHPEDTSIGELYLVNAIHDEDSGQTFFPDILLRHVLKEKHLTTVSEGITENGDRYQGLVDMEGSIIFRLMVKKVPPHRLIFLKVVSDHMDVKDWKSLDVSGLIKNQIGKIQTILDGLDNEVLSDRNILNKAEMEMINRGAVRLKFTETQYIQLVDWSENYIKRSSRELKNMKFYFDKESKTKQERNRIFGEIRQFLST
ncbi:MAG: hypothetical protein HOA15_05140 [Candidatus Marinimicrobia bacterium]|nr:hypothetical protein [Candidatus Neomarinimicrobiota bacterium]MBT3677013.1 hypothetical protein [Candidatus Neomarinimicrobiota bacterium]MBT3763981.1 hypothetical protein [Candidatus Neomarinimicrobiota bacterium]MBT4069013.1 hypothetical protein [Candidatus Neomarinimicrobiota bacterium]MBT4271390.1 hypothetical protein [Candidatus Neomarinimicrobiota bacterium]